MGIAEVPLTSMAALLTFTRGPSTSIDQAAHSSSPARKGKESKSQSYCQACTGHLSISELSSTSDSVPATRHVPRSPGHGSLWATSNPAPPAYPRILIRTRGWPVASSAAAPSFDDISHPNSPVGPNLYISTSVGGLRPAAPRQRLCALASRAHPCRRPFL